MFVYISILILYLTNLSVKAIPWIVTVSVSTQLYLMFIHFYAFCNTIIDVLFTLDYKYFVMYK